MKFHARNFTRLAVGWKAIGKGAKGGGQVGRDRQGSVVSCQCCRFQPAPGPRRVQAREAASAE